MVFSFRAMVYWVLDHSPEAQANPLEKPPAPSYMA